ncbi:MAG: HAD-IA family hydrolase [Candidatus Bathyarchaeia archaeon]
MIEAVIFDLDGTLIHLPINYEELFKKLSEITRLSNVRPLTKVIAQLDEETRKRVFEVWSETELKASANVKVNNTGIAHYRKFSDKQKALVTMQGKPLVQIVIKQLGLIFNHIVTREDSLNRVEQLRIAAEKLRTPMRNILFVGNTDEDMHASEIVGCQFLRVE